jgi:UDP-N-acetylglucosamine 2-epimerase (non-hydrolysing)
MNKIFFDELKIPEPDYHLGVGSGTHGEQTGEMPKRTEEALIKTKFKEY